MVKEFISKNGEINLVQLTRILLNGKKNIIFSTFISLILGLIFGFYNNKFKAKIELSNGNKFEFTKYRIINEVVKTHYNLLNDNFSDLNNNISDLNDNFSEDLIVSINSSSVFNQFIKEFNDNEEVIKVLKNKGLSLDKNPEMNTKYIAQLAKNFYIDQEESTLGNVYNLNFIWGDLEEAIEIIEESINLTLDNIRVKQVNLIQEIINLFESEKKLIFKKIDLLEDVTLLRAKANKNKQIEFLTQHKKMANKLGIIKNRFDPKNNPVYDDYSNLDYYLKGYQNIETELARVKSLSNEQLLLENAVFTQQMIKAKQLKTQFVLNELKESLLLLDDDSYKNWIKYNTELIFFRPIKSKFLILVTFIILGFLIASFSEIVKFQIYENSHKQ